MMPKKKNGPFPKMRSAMKKTLLFAAFAAALIFSVSCNKETRNDVPEQPALRTVTFNAISPETKTVFGDKSGTKYPVLWQAGDKINYSFNFGDIPTTALAVTPSADGTTASFSGKFAESSSYQFIFVSPAEAFKSRNKSEGTIMVEFPSGQSSTAASPDPSAQILYANTGELTELPDPLEVNFTHLSAYLHLQFANVDLGDAEVQAVNVTSEDHYIAGRIFYHFNDDNFTESTSSMFHTIAIATTTLTDVWCALRPVDLSGKSLTITVSTDKGTLTKTVNMPASAVLTRGKIAKFTVDMTGVAMESAVIYKVVTDAAQLHVGDKVIIAAADEEQAYAMSTGQNSNNRSQAGVTKTLTEITNPSDMVEIIQLEDGFVPGHYAFKATGTANPGYLYAASLDGTANYLRTQSTIDVNASWDVSIETVTINGVTTENAAVIVADAPSPASNVIRHNATSVLFSAYQPTSKQGAVMLYRLDEPADESLRFKATLPDGENINATAQSVNVYVFGNVAWTASVTGGATLSATSGTGNSILTLSVPENTDTENTKSYAVTVSTSAAVTTQSYTLNITQAKKINAGGDPEVVYSFFLAAAGSNLGSNGTYAGNCDVEISNITWNVTGVSNSPDYAGWRLGGKSITNVTRAIYSKTALAAEVTKVVISHSRMNITMNSFTFSVHSSAADAASGSNPVASFTATVNVGTQDAPATNTFEKADDTSWAGCFYRIAYNVTNTTTSNKYVEFRGLEMWGYPAN